MKKLLPVALLLLLAITATAQNIETFAGNFTFGNTGDFGPATAASLSVPKAVVADGAGNIYIASANAIRKVSTTGIITLFAGSATSYGYWGDGGFATSAGLYAPTGLAVDAAGNVYIADQGNHCIRKVNTSGIISTVAGIPGIWGFTGDGGTATAAKLQSPYGVAVDAAGNLYISDKGNERVRKVTAGIINTIAGNGYTGFAGDGGLATAARLQDPAGLAVDASGNIYLADHGNARIRKITPSGIITTFAGTGAVGYSGDGVPASSAALNYIYGVSVDATGDVYIPDYLNYRVRKVSGGIISTVAGTGTAGSTGDGGPATAATLQVTYSITFYSGNIYIADGDNNKVRVMPCPGGVPTVSAISGAGTICQTSAVVLTNTASGGTWISSAPGVANISATSGVVLGISGGTAIITYQKTTACGSASATAAVTVTPLPDAGTLSGTFLYCVGSTGSLSSTAPGGVWSSSDPSAVINSTTGAVNAVSFGSPTITYTLTNACGSSSVGHIIYIDAGAPAIGTITSAATLCQGTGFILSATSPGGSWTSNAPAIATVNADGTVGGIAAGTATITYTKANGCGTVYTTAPVTVHTALLPGYNFSPVAGTGVGGFGPWGGPAIYSAISDNLGMAADNAHNLYFVDGGYLAKIDNTGIISLIPMAFGTSVNAVTSDNFGNVFFSTYTGGGSGYYSIQKIDPSGTISTFAYVTVGEWGLCTDIAGNLYVNDNAAQKIKKITPSGVISVYAGNGTYGLSGDGGPATDASLTYIAGMTMDVSGNLYLAHRSDQIIRKVDASGIITTFAGTGTAGFAGDGGPATAAMFNAPFGLSADAQGNIYVADALNNRIRKIAATTGTISTIAGNGSTTFAGSWAPALSAGLYVPRNVYVDKSNNIIVGDDGHRRIYSINTYATITGDTAVCTGGTISFTDPLYGGVGAWSTTDTAIAPVNSSGMANGLASGFVYITYTIDQGCGIGQASAPLSVIGQPQAGTLSGTDSVCAGGVTHLTPSVAGGAWASSNASIAAAIATGDVTGYTAGTAVISYIVSNYCGADYALDTITVHAVPLPGTITAPASLCADSVVQLSETAAGGVWGVSNANATISAGGLLTGVTAGSVVVSYTVTNGMCSAGTSATVNITNCVVVNGVTVPTATAPKLLVFPNPNNGQFAITVESPVQEAVTILITDLLGNKVATRQGITSSAINIAMPQVAGIYTLRVLGATIQASAKIVVE